MIHRICWSFCIEIVHFVSQFLKVVSLHKSISHFVLETNFISRSKIKVEKIERERVFLCKFPDKRDARPPAQKCHTDPREKSTSTNRQHQIRERPHIPYIYGKVAETKVMVLQRQKELDNVLGRVYMHFYHSKRVGMAPGHFEQVYRRLYAYI